MPINNHIKQFREKKSVTQEQLGGAVGVSRQTILAMEKGNYEPSLKLAMQLAKYFQVRVEELFRLQ